MFLTDGQQTPASAKEPPFLLERGKIPGMIVGVGNLLPVPIPKLDNDNVQSGFWQIQQAERRRGRLQSATGDYLSSVQEQKLQRLAKITGLSYHHLESPAQLSEALRKANLRQRRRVDYDLRGILAATALLIFIAPTISFRIKHRS